MFSLAYVLFSPFIKLVQLYFFLFFFFLKEKKIKEKLFDSPRLWVRIAASR